MNRLSSTYCQTIPNATHFGPIVGFTSSGTDPRKGRRTPLNKNRYSEQRDEETGLSYFGARYYDADLLTGWLSVDPMADKYPSLSPYNYCASNPMKLVDPDGSEVLPTSAEALETIRKTVPREARQYIQLGRDGLIDKQRINSFHCESRNYNDLKELVNQESIIEVSIVSSYEYIDAQGDCSRVRNQLSPAERDDDFLDKDGLHVWGTSTGEYSGENGVTAMPTSEAIHMSTNDNVQIYINSALSDQARAEVFSHEFYGHAYLFVTQGYQQSIHHNNDRDNLTINNRIISAKHETVMNNKMP